MKVPPARSDFASFGTLPAASHSTATPVDLYPRPDHTPANTAL
jgi:hypothetical protein